MSLPWKWVRRAAAFATACYVGLQIRIPGIRPEGLGEAIWTANDSALLKFFDAITGHGLTRGSILALSITPFLAARLYVWLGKKAFPQLAALEETQGGRAQLKRWTRLLNLSIALAQSYGYARFLQGIPNVVVTPGPVFIIGTMALLTTGAVVMMHLSERITATEDDAPHATDVAGSIAASRQHANTPDAIHATPAHPSLGAPQPVDGILATRVVRTPVEVTVPK